MPGADMVKFAKNGSDVTTAAVKLARAATGRPIWWRCAGPSRSSPPTTGSSAPPHMDAGIPDAQRELTVGFDYNDLGSVESLLLAAFRGRSPASSWRRRLRTAEPEPGFLEGAAGPRRPRRVRPRLRRDHHRHALVEGRRAGVYGTTPDLSTWGKALGNGFAVSALAGRRELMELGGLRTGRRAGLPAVHDARAGDHGAGRLPGGRRGLPASGTSWRSWSGRAAGSPTG